MSMDDFARYEEVAREAAYLKGYADGKRDAAPRWVRVEDELPDDGEMVLICEQPGSAVWFGMHEKDGRWCWVDTFESGYADVSHWMPIPEPPGEGA